jgi:MFS superfamily sulfate permease-like transporter
VVSLALQRWLAKVPAMLVMVGSRTAATSLFRLADHGVGLVGVLPEGFPPLTLPHVSLADVGPLLGGALGIVLVSLADTISTASAFGPPPAALTRSMSFKVRTNESQSQV